VSGNPNGRPKPPEELVHVRENARAYTTEAVETLAEVMRDKGAPPSARVTAANALLDRGWGKPDANLNVTTKREACDLTDDELAAIAAGAAAIHRAATV
jgi:hypothetical protein